MTTDLKAIKRRLRDLRSNPGQPGARAEMQRLIGELTRAQQARDVSDMTGPANRTTAQRQSGEAPRDQAPRDPDLPRRLDQPITGRETSEPSGSREPIMWGNDDVSSWPPELRSRRRVWRS
ncbi:hypothetical protein [Streptomyces sp. NPDC051665]|uniref:hypothetical protein n=1 Tax=Streptomyces sp. NPDC051665 TaxID=3154647 RepID=UPI003422F374